MHSIPSSYISHAVLLPRPASLPHAQCTSIASKHRLHHVSQRAPVIPSTRQSVLLNEQDIVLETRIHVWFQPQLDHHRMVVAIDVCIHPVQPFEHLSDQRWERFRKWHTWWRSVSAQKRGSYGSSSGPTDPAWEHGLVVNVALDPGH